MAGRTSTSVGVGVTIVLLSVATLGLFVTAAIYFGKFQTASRERLELRQQTAEFVTENERRGDRERRILEQAKGARQSVVGYLRSSYEDAMRQVTGSDSDTPTQLKEKLAAIPGAEASPLLQVVADLRGRIANLENSLARSDEAAKTAQADRLNEVARVKQIEDSHQRTIASLNTEVNRYKDEIDQYRVGTDKVRADMEARVSRIAAESGDREQRLQTDLTKLREQNLVLQGQITELRGQRNQDLLRPADEFALVDGTILALNSAENQVVISVGSRQKVQLAMAFSVYQNGSAIRPDPTTGEYPRGKAGLEVINVNENSATCRILWEARGNPIIKGDVVANPVFDPNKIYKMVVYGNFDVNRDSIATPLEASDLEALIQAWGGKVTPDLSGDVDFLVLGERPILPPRPPTNAPTEIVLNYISLDQKVQRYDQLLQQALATSVPILNENRLYTLLGKTPPPLRR